MAKNEIISMLRQKIAELENRPPNILPPSYSTILQGNERHIPEVSAGPNIPSIIIKPKQHQDSNKTNVDVKRNIKPSELKVSIKGTRILKNGGMVIKCSNKSDVDILKKEAENEEDNIKITYIKRPEKLNALNTVFGECPPDVFRKLMTAKKVFIDWQRYSVVEDLGIPRCFNCQQYYHRMDTCPNTTVCEVCAGDHNIKDCLKLNKKCNNCQIANEKYR
ncbi:unnamed protein product [Ceutorhynchus assimilis]|uniref:Gag-like protein n=1 Tax=Ceutorhynchus assimilis TaxID=467358 RepID=A0A9N9MK82_9CUCU|nr:unnamed protein product [Ceutorhynchus assimilis]